jgi:death-on-curing protein
MEQHEILINKAIKFNNIVTYLSNNNNVLRDRGLLESAISSPFQSMFGEDLYKTVEEKAFVLFLNIAKNHPFMDGNKRTAALICDYYLMENGMELNLETKEKFKFMLNVLEKNIEPEQALFIFKELVVPIESISRKPITEEIKSDFLNRYNQISETLNLNFEKSLNKNILEKFVLEYSKTNCINYVDLIKTIEQNEVSKLENELNNLNNIKEGIDYVK